MHRDEHDNDELRRRLEEGFFLQNVSPGAFDFFEHRDKWQTLIILDACRFDAFEKVNRIAGSLQKRISVASCTEDWVSRCLDRPLDDVAYVSASPYVSKWYLEQLGVANRLGRLEEVWRDGWDDDLHTVRPQAVLDAHRRLLAEMPSKKFVLHFMQPHHPYIGLERLKGAGWRKFFGAMELDVPELEGLTPIEMLEDGKVTREEVVRAYESNLAMVLGCIEAAIAGMPRPIVVTADHGEAFGECGVYGHPCGTPMAELITVPYLEIK